MVQVSNITTTGKAYVGVLLAYVKQARLIDDHLNGNCDGLMVTESSDVNVSDSEISNNCGGITISRSPNFTLAHSVISGNGEGMFEDASTNTTVTGNLFASNSYTGARLGGGANVVVSQNHIQDNGGDGLIVDNVVNALIQGNWISGSGGAGILISAANGLNITANTLLYNHQGISLIASPFSGGGSVYNTIVYHNNFVYNLIDQADHIYGETLAWDNGYPSGGNFWSDYTGVDRCGGVSQDICPQPDGVGDTPYTGIIQITSGCCDRSPSPLVDHYPIMNPFGNVTQDTKPPLWPNGSNLALARVNSTSVSLRWSKANDDTWVSKYQIAENGTVIATVPGNILSYTLSGLSSGSSYVFKIDAGDPADMMSTDGPSNVITLRGNEQNPNPPTSSPSNLSPFRLAWWVQNPAWSYAVVATAAIGAGSILLVRRRVIAARAKQLP